MSITALPTPPQRSDSTNFPARADAFMSALPTFGTEANALQVDVNDKQVQAANSATAAATSAGNALSSANASAASAAASIAASTAAAWVSGTTYVAGSVVYSTINYRSYRRIITGAGTTDPSSDSTNWTQISVNPQGLQVFTSSGSFTIPNGAQFITVDMVGGGGSGSAGDNTSGRRGSGGGGGERIVRTYPASYFTSPVSVVVGTGGASVTSTGSGTLIGGINGAGSSFGTLIAHGGKAGDAAGAGGGGGGIFVASSASYPAFGQVGAWGPSTGIGGYSAEWGGGSGGGEGQSAPTFGGASINGGAGGAGAYTTSGSARGGVSGTYQVGDSSGASMGVNGANAATNLVSGSGGGFGYNVKAGDGGFPGGGGGGSYHYSAVSTSGKGGDGVVRVYWW